MSLDSATSALSSGRLPKRPLLITIDDAKIEILRITDVFASFALPISIFATAGWCAQESASGDDAECLLPRIVVEMEWYRGSVKLIETKRGRLTLGANAEETGRAIDLILANIEDLQPEFESIMAKLKSDSHRSHHRVSCSWAELNDLKQAGAAIGGHSVSHVNLAAASPLRMQFEILESYRILCAKFGSCEVFAYPYGMNGTFSEATTAQLSRAGFRYAFLTHSAFATKETDPLHLPRISMPDRPMSHPEFCIRAAGAGVFYRKIKQSISTQSGIGC